MAISKIITSSLTDDAVTSAKIGTDQVGADALSSSAISGAVDIPANSVGESELSVDYTAQSVPHIVPGVLQPAVAGKLLNGANHSGAYGTAQTQSGGDGHSYYYTDIKGSKPIKDPRIGAHFGSQRHKFKSLQLLEQETATHGKDVFSIDGREWCRAVGEWSLWTDSNVTGSGIIVPSSSTTSFIEIVGYFSTVNYIAYTDTNDRSVRVTIDGGTESGTVYAGANSGGNPLGDRYVDSGMLQTLTTSTLGLHTIKIRKQGTGATTAVNAIELIAQDTSNRNNIQIPSQNVVSHGKKFNVSGTPHYDPFNGFTSGSSVSSYVDTATSLGLDKWLHSSTYYRPYNGGRVVKWVDSSGTIKTSVTLMPPNAKSIADSSSLTNATAKANASASNDTFYPTFEAHTTDVNEDQLNEVAKTFHWREFGNGSANGGTGSSTYADASMLNSEDNIAYVMDDGLTALSAKEVFLNSTPYMYTKNLGSSEYYITFIGTGLSTIKANANNEHVHVAQNLSYGTHILRFFRNSSTSDVYLDGVQLTGSHTDLSAIDGVTFHQPKMPPIPEDACVLADYMLMADYVARTASGSGSNISKGIRRVVSRDIFYDAGAAFNTLSFQPDVNYAPTGIKAFVGSDRSAGDIKNKLPAFGTRFEVGSYASRLDNFFVNGVSVDETSSGSTYTAFTTQDADSTLGNNIFEARNSATNNGNSSYFDVATPIHTSSHYQSFETPFLHELVGGDRNMEQHNLVVSPDGKTWDGVTRDTSYHSKASFSIRGGPNTDNGNVVLFTTFRGISGNSYPIQKNFAIAYDRFICLREGTYQLNAQTISSTSTATGGHAQIKVNGTEIALAHAGGSSHTHNHTMAIAVLKRGDYVQVHGKWYGGNGYSALQITRL